MGNNSGNDNGVCRYFRARVGRWGQKTEIRGDVLYEWPLRKPPSRQQASSRKKYILTLCNDRKYKTVGQSTLPYVGTGIVQYF